MQTLDHLECGAVVIVTKFDGDLFANDFTGSVIRIGDRFAYVLDGDGEEWGCVPDQIELTAP
jgi:hypothetical protein